MKVYTYEELERFCERAVEGDDREKKYEQAEEFIKSRPYLNKAQKKGLLDYLGFLLMMSYDGEEDWDDGGNPFTPDYLDRDSRDYGPSNPWNAPGMRVSDFITGVSPF